LSVSAPSPQTDGIGQQWAFNNWSDGGAASHTITTLSTATTYTTTFTLVSPSATPTPTPALIYKRYMPIVYGP